MANFLLPRNLAELPFCEEDAFWHMPPRKLFASTHSQPFSYATHLLKEDGQQTTPIAHIPLRVAPILLMDAERLLKAD